MSAFRLNESTRAGAKALAAAAARTFRVRPLAGRLLLYVLLFSLVLSFVATGLQLLSDYREERARLIELQERVADMLAPTLAMNLDRGLWADAERQVDGLLSLPGIQFVQVSTHEGRVFERGAPLGSRMLERVRPLRVEDPTGESRVVGRLGLVSSLEPLYQQMWQQAMLSLLIHGIVVLVGALGLMLIVRMTLTRHLETMADYARELDFDALIAPLKLKRSSRGRPDELGELEKALNTMRMQLLGQARQIRESEVHFQDERDAAVRANQAKNLFLANVSHELRTPLQSVLGYASLLEDSLQASQLDPEQRDYVLTLKRSAENLSSIINDLLDISRMEAGKLTLESLPFDLRETLEDVVTMLGPKARDKRLALETRVDPHLPSGVLGDPIRCRQIMLNLVANAIRFTDSGHIMISAEVLDRTAKGMVKLRLSVEDTGSGIAPEDLPLIYEPYVHFEQRASRELSDAGLGLTVCRQLVELMNGQLEVESTPGKGSTFWVALKLPVARETSAHVRVDTRAIRGTRILVADSYELSRKLSLDLLAGFGAEAQGVRSAGEVLQRLEEAVEVNRPFSALLVDGFLPDMDCDQLCQRIRASKHHSDTRILVLSSNPQRGDAEHFRQAGADAFLSKALRESLLGPLLQQMFTGRHSKNRTFLTRFSLVTAAPWSPRPAELPCAEIKVLLVEDNPVNRALTERILGKFGARVVSVNDGEAAVERCQYEGFDLVFMDCVLPGIDGFETTRRLRKIEQEKSRAPVPVVALTANAMEKDEEMCREAGMDAFVAKPVTQDMLRAVLVQFCPGTRAGLSAEAAPTTSGSGSA